MSDDLKKLLASYCLPQTTAYTLVFINGVWCKEFSVDTNLATEFILELRANNQCVINVLPNTNLSKPLHFLFFSVATIPVTNHEHQIAHKNLFTIGENSQVSIIEEYVDNDMLNANRFSELKEIDPSSLEFPQEECAVSERSAFPYMSTRTRAQQSGKPKCDGYNVVRDVVTHIKAEKSAQINYYKIYNPIKNTVNTSPFTTNAELQLELATRCAITTQHLIFGAAHHNINEKISAVLTAPHISCINKGLYMLNTQQLKFDVNIEHAVSNCTSKNLFKGIIANHAQATFFGKITVREGAEQTIARLDNKNLLLHDSAHVTTSPALEIYADDVQCSHGATVGQLDENALWYLQSRGIPEVAARNMLVQAFMQEIIGTLPEYLKGKIWLGDSEKI